MNNTVASIVVGLLILLGVGGRAVAQGALPEDLSEFYSYGDNYFVEVVAAPAYNAAAPGKGRAIFIVRFTYDLLNFRRNVGAGAGVGGVYRATPSLFVETMNSEGVIVDRGTWRDTVGVDDFAATNAKDSLVAAVLDMSLRPGTYTIKYSFDDGTPGSGFTQTMPPFRMPDFVLSRPIVGTPIFLRDVRGDTILAEAIDGNASFGRPIRVWIPIGGAEPVAFRYELLRAAIPGRHDYIAVRSGAGTIRPNVGVGPGFTLGSGIGFRLVAFGSEPTAMGGGSSGALVEIATDDLPMGDYLLALVTDGMEGTSRDTVKFQYRWVDIPFSLAQIDYAIRTLYPVADDATIDRLSDGEKGRQRERLNAFWAERDPSAGTVWNEAMAEYYRRVDYSFFNFKSIGQNDGAFTDRGKIYILNGPPTEVRREMQPESPPREIWIYRNAVARSFVFQDDARAGDYRLVAYHDLDPSDSD